MKIRTMRVLDRLLGVPVCALLSAWRKLLPRRLHPALPTVRTILFIKLVEQGTTVLARPAFAAAVARVGRDNVYCLTLAENAEILNLLKLIPESNVIAVPGRSGWSIFLGLARAIRTVRKLGIDAVVDLEFFARTSAILSFLTGARLRAGLSPGPGAGPWRGHLLTHPILHQPDLHTAQLYEVLVRSLEVPAELLPALPFCAPPVPRWSEPCYVPEPQAIGRMMQLLGNPDTGESGCRLFILNANAGDLEPLRRWPEERYVELAQRLLAAHPAAIVVFTGSAPEAAATAALAAQVSSSRCRSLAGRTSLEELFTLFAICDVLVSNDSGPAHFASLTSASSVVLFGPETPRRFGPLAVRSLALSAGLACSPCLSAFNNRRSACRDNLCLQRIGVEEVLAAVESQLH